MAFIFPPRDRVGVVLGLSATQLGLIGTAMAALVFAMSGRRIVVMLLAMTIALVLAFAGWGGELLSARIGRQISWSKRAIAGHNEWAAPIGCPGTAHWPRVLAGLDLRPVEPSGLWPTGQPFGVAQRGREVSIVLPVSGPQMALASEDETEHRLAGWSETLATLCAESSESGIARVSWTDAHTAPDTTSLKRHHEDRGVDGPASQDYREQLASVGGTASSHSVFVTLTVNLSSVASRTVTARKVKGDDLLDMAVVDHASAFARALVSRGFTVGRPLTPLGVSRLIRRLGDPFALIGTREMTVTEQLGIAHPADAAPQAVSAERLHVAIDGAVHRTYEVQWPSRVVAADWLVPLQAAGGGPKFMTVVYEPIAPSRSAAQLTRRMTKVSSDVQVKSKRAGRVTANQRRQLEALEQRDNELSRGHAEVSFYGLVVVSARRVEELDRRGIELERAAQRCGGARVRPLHTRHDLGWAAALPIGVRVARAAA